MDDTVISVDDLQLALMDDDEEKRHSAAEEALDLLCYDQEMRQVAAQALVSMGERYPEELEGLMQGLANDLKNPDNVIWAQKN